MTNPRVVSTREETSEEKALREWFAKQALASPQTLDAAARLLITLVTGFFTLLFGVLAVAEHPLPGYFTIPAVRILGVISVAALFLTLLAALAVVLPQRMSPPSARPDEQRAAFDAMLQHKARFLTLAAFTFGGGIAALGAVLIIALLTV